jgi:Flp pilus assembly protein TadD
LATSVSLRKSLRKIPDFRLLTGRELELILGRMICKDYQPGEVIWRTRGQTDYLTILQRGEIVLEHRIYGSLVRSKRLLAGDYLLPRKFKLQNPHSMILARAVTNTRLYVLPREQINVARTKLSHVQVSLSRPPFYQGLLWNSLWLGIVTLLILFLTWTDLTRIASGVLYIASTGTNRPAFDEPTSMKLLEYAEAIDRRADFAYNREGYIWFRHDNLPQAEAAFMKALNANQTNGSALNNQAVTYFTTGQIPQAALYQQKAAEHDPDNAIVQYNLGLVMLKDNDNVQAIREFREASFINPVWVLPYLQQGLIYIQTRDYVNAERVARHAVSLDSTQQSAYLILAIALHNQGRQQEALQAVETALRITPDDRVSLFYQARILMGTGEFDRAFAILNQLLDSADNPQEVSRINAEIEAWQRYRQNVPSGVP